METRLADGRNTLVVDVTNLNGYNWLDDAGNFFTDTVHMVERWTMIDPDTIHYQVTIEDPRVYTRPWTMSWALVREKEPGFELLEEACWEGERDLSGSSILVSSITTGRAGDDARDRHSVPLQ